MTALNKQALREAAEKALPAMKRLLMMPNDELFDEALLNVDGDVDAANAFSLIAGPETMLALLDALEAAENNLIDSECHVAELEESLRDKQALLEALDNSLCEILPGTQYMDPPDGGSVTPLEQVHRMVADYRYRIAELEEKQRLIDICQGQGLEHRIAAEKRAESAEKRIAELESNEIREDGNQFLVVRHPGKTPAIKHCSGDLEEFLRHLIEQDPLVTIDIITHRHYGVGGQWVQDGDEHLHMMTAAGIGVKGE
ncbi:ead/Ea22-like family protein [Salmonella enterica]|nr:ead/Ea22-like family protein [Salmonella enterica]EGP8905139.1 ead/Ea22-like family protein [Salmonella enterica]EIT0306344.1 ead/Ea22-like family protein [Salmonella enterica]EKG7379858.1 ead/Ea22-like family protein [Salmonella enterica]EKJ9276799.1 ead/Ea22-like family protein [Salmonella enterica]